MAAHCGFLMTIPDGNRDGDDRMTTLGYASAHTPQISLQRLTVRDCIVVGALFLLSSGCLSLPFVSMFHSGIASEAWFALAVMVGVIGSGVTYLTGGINIRRGGAMPAGPLMMLPLTDR